MFLVLFVRQMLGVSDATGLPLTLAFSVVAVVETVVLLLWFRRPVAHRGTGGTSPPADD